MTFYQLRFFNTKGCFSVLEYRSLRKATDVFNGSVEFAKAGRLAAQQTNVTMDIVANYIQLLERNEWMDQEIIESWQEGAA